MSQEPLPRKSFLWKEGALRSNHAVHFPKGTWHQTKIWERKSPSRGIIQRCERHERSLCTPKFEERSQEETLQGQVALLKECIFNWIKNMVYSPIEARATPASTSKLPEEREFVIDSRASMHMLSKKDLSSEELETQRRSRTSTVVVTANGEVQTSVEAQEFVHDHGLFVAVQLLEDALAVPQLGKLCEEHGY